MVWVPGGTFAMGSLDFYPEEGPVHQATVEGLWVDRAPVSNADFAAFVADTGFVTTAEQPLDPEVFRSEEGPFHQATVEGLWVDRAPVSNADFAAFVADTGFVTTAEQPLDPEVFADLDDYSAG